MNWCMCHSVYDQCNCLLSELDCMTRRNAWNQHFKLPIGKYAINKGFSSGTCCVGNNSAGWIDRDCLCTQIIHFIIALCRNIICYHLHVANHKCLKVISQDKVNSTNHSIKGLWQASKWMIKTKSLKGKFFLSFHLQKASKRMDIYTCLQEKANLMFTRTYKFTGLIITRDDLKFYYIGFVWFWYPQARVKIYHLRKEILEKKSKFALSLDNLSRSFSLLHHIQVVSCYGGNYERAWWSWNLFWSRRYKPSMNLE